MLQVLNQIDVKFENGYALEGVKASLGSGFQVINNKTLINLYIHSKKKESKKESFGFLDRKDRERKRDSKKVM